MATKTDSLASLRNIAQYTTVVSATFYGLLWIIGEITNHNIANNTFGGVLIALTSLGGLAMGLLYAVAIASNKRSK